MTNRPIPPDGDTAKHLARMVLTVEDLREQMDAFVKYLYELNQADSPEFGVRGITPMHLLTLAEASQRLAMAEGSLASVFMWTQEDIQAGVDAYQAGRAGAGEVAQRQTLAGIVVRAHIVLDTDRVPDDASEA